MALNVTGLALGLACALLIGFYVADEFAFDRFHPEVERLYRVEEQPEAGRRWAGISAMHGPALEAEFPEIEHAARLFSRRFVLGTDRVQLDGVSVAWTDPVALELFGFPVVEGDPATMLTRPGTVVLTLDTKKQLFGDAPALGQIVRRENTEDLEVSGVIERPSHSHFEFDVLVPFETVWTDFAWLDQWGASTTPTYVRLREGADPAATEAAFPEYLARHIEGVEPDQALFLQPITDLRLRPATTGSTGTLGTIRLFGLISVLVLLLAGINYVNLATARAADRMKEVGMRKVLGARRLDLTLQLLGESVLLAGAAYVVALVLVSLALPFVNTLADKELMLMAGSSLQLVGLFAGVALGVGLGAGLYPALYLSRFRPTQVLKGRALGGGSGRLRQGLVVVQFAVTIALITGTFIVREQLQYLSTRDLGFSGEQVLSISQQGDAATMQTLKQELLRLPQVISVGQASAQPGQIGWSMSVVPSDTTLASAEEPLVSFMLADADYLPTMQMDLVAGRNFSDERISDAGNTLILNTSAARLLGFADPVQAVGRRFDVGQYQDAEVVGVVADFHFASLRQDVQPLVFAYDPDNTTVLAVKVGAADIPATLAAVEQVWSRIVPSWPLTYSFVDEDFAALYRSEQRLVGLVSVFAGLAILIACLGLFGLAAYVAERRTKEIGVRKVLGASVPGLVGLLNRDFVMLVLIGFAVATPVAFFAMSRWLDGFAYRLSLTPWPFVLAGGAALLIALLTVSIHAIRAASTDPVKALRYE